MDIAIAWYLFRSTSTAVKELVYQGLRLLHQRGGNCNVQEKS